MSQKTFRLPDLGEGLTESEIVTWRVAEGDAVSVNQVLADVETAKAVVEVSSPFAGVVAALHGAEGETLEVGAPLVTFTLEGAEPDVGGPAEGDGRVPTLVGYGAAPDTGNGADRQWQPDTDPHRLPLLDADNHARALSDIEADVIAHALGHYDGQMSEIARRLGIGRSTLYRKLREYGIGEPRH